MVLAPLNHNDMEFLSKVQQTTLSQEANSVLLEIKFQNGILSSPIVHSSAISVLRNIQISEIRSPSSMLVFHSR